MDPLLEALANLWRESGAGDELRLIGDLPYDCTWVRTLAGRLTSTWSP